MTDRLLEQLATTDGPADPGSAFRERLWAAVDAELHGVAPPAAVTEEMARSASPADPSRRRHRTPGALAWIRASRTRTVPVAAAVITLLSLGVGVLLQDGPRRDAEQTVEVVDDPTAEPSPPTPTSTPGPLGPPAVIGAPSAAKGASPASGSTTASRRPAAAVPPAVAPGPGSVRRPWTVLYGASVGGVSGVYSAVAGESGTQRAVVAGGSYNAQPVLSPSRRQLAWTRGIGNADVRSIWVAGADGSGPRELPLAKCAAYSVCEYRWPTFSPEGTQMAFMRGTANSSCTPAQDCSEIVVYDVRSGSVTAVGYGDSPEWSPSRAEIAYSGAAGPELHQACEAVNCADREIRIVDVSGASAESRRVGSVLGYAPRFSPDGEWLVYEAVQTSTAVVVRRDGSAERTVPGCEQPNWAPDGRLACMMAVAGGRDVFLLDASDRRGQRLTFTAGAEAQFRIYAL